MATLSGKKGLIIGIANEHSLAYGCARHFRAAGAELAITYLNAKAEPYVRPLAEALKATSSCPAMSPSGPTRGRLRAHRHGVGPPRFRPALDRLCPQGGSDGGSRIVRPRDSAWPCRSRFNPSCRWRSSANR